MGDDRFGLSKDWLHGADSSGVGEEGGGRQRQAGGGSDRYGREAEGLGAREPRTSPGERDSSQGVRVFRPGGARPPGEAMIAFIDDHREVYGVEPICKVLPIAPSTYHAHIAQRIDASKRSARAQRDAELKIEVQRVFAENFGVYGVRKVWRQLRREGFAVARCNVERLVASPGLQGAIRGKPVRTTISHPSCCHCMTGLTRKVSGGGRKSPRN